VNVKSVKNYSAFSDEELIEQLNSNGEDAIAEYLLEKYKPLVRKLSNEFYIIGGDSNDLLQEGMIGLFKAIRDYKSGKDATFFTFANICIRRQLYTAMEASKRLKHAPLNSYVSLSATDTEGGNEANEEIAKRFAESPEDYVIEQEFWERFYNEIWERLSKMERQVLELYREGMTYTEIAVKLQKEPKAIDNALQRIRKKVSLWSFQESEITASGA